MRHLLLSVCLLLLACASRPLVDFKEPVGEEPPPEEELMCTFAAPECQSVFVPPVEPIDPNSFVGAVQSCVPQVVSCDGEPVIGVPCGSLSACEAVKNGEAAPLVSGCNMSENTSVTATQFDMSNVNCSVLKYNIAAEGALSFVESELENVTLVLQAGLASSLAFNRATLTNVDIRLIGAGTLSFTSSTLSNVRIFAEGETVVQLSQSELTKTNIKSATIDSTNTLWSDSLLSGITVVSVDSDFEASRIDVEDVTIDGGTIQNVIIDSALANIAVPSIEELNMASCLEATFRRSNLSKSSVTSCSKLQFIGSRIDDSIIGSVVLTRTDVRGSVIYAGRSVGGRLTATSSSIAASALCGVTQLQAEATEFDCFSCDVISFLNKRTDGVRIKGSSCDALNDT